MSVLWSIVAWAIAIGAFVLLGLWLFGLWQVAVEEVERWALGRVNRREMSRRMAIQRATTTKEEER